MYGYAGKILSVDLTSGSIETTPLDENFARSHIGGIGFVTKFYLDLIRENPRFDALDAANPFIIMTGPLTGVKAHGVARWACGTKSPLTGLWADANVGGHFGALLKFAGYDGIIIRGASPEPISLTIADDRIELSSARQYWGKDIYETTDGMIADHAAESGRKGQVFAIGPAGENLVRFASIINDKSHCAGRAGMGAVWGAKRLKAIHVRGTGTIESAHPGRLETLKDELKEAYSESIFIDAIGNFGTATYMDVGIMSGDIPMKNWQQSEWDDFDDIGPLAYEEKILAGRKTCYGCGVACKREAEVTTGPFRFPRGPGPEYETVAAFGALCLNTDIESIARANDICNRYGMDTVTCGSTIAFAMECFEKGLITEEDTDGVRLTWGNAAAIVDLTEKIGRREGFGALLAEGSGRAAETIGGDARACLTTVKGMEAPMHDPRSYHSFGLAYAVSPRGACHTESPIFPIQSGGLYFPDIPELADEQDGMDSTGKAPFVIAGQDFGAFLTGCAIFCNLGISPLTASQAVAMVNHVTGFDYTIEEVTALGRRIWYLQRGLSNLFGARAVHDRLPPRLMTPLTDGPSAGSRPDMDLMLKEYYELRKFTDDGIPERKVLIALDLQDLADLLYRAE